MQITKCMTSRLRLKCARFAAAEIKSLSWPIPHLANNTADYVLTTDNTRNNINSQPDATIIILLIIIIVASGSLFILLYQWCTVTQTSKNTRVSRVYLL